MQRKSNSNAVRRARLPQMETIFIPQMCTIQLNFVFIIFAYVNHIQLSNS